MRDKQESCSRALFYVYWIETTTYNKIDIMKHRLTHFAVLIMALAIPQSMKAYDFSAVCSTGQTLYYNISGNNVSVTYENDSMPPSLM